MSFELTPPLSSGCGCSGGTEVLSCCGSASGQGGGIVRILASDITRRKFLGACCATGFGIVASGSIATILAACGSESTAAGATTLRGGHLRSEEHTSELQSQSNLLFR